MARRTRPSFTKRQKEMARQQRQQDKDARRLELRRQKTERQPSTTDATDPEIEGIRPGPQPPPAWMELPQRKS